MDYDVIIVGARVAGSNLAILLGRQGRRVLLVDRDPFPSDTLSIHLLHPPAVELLGRLGALAEALGATLDGAAWEPTMADYRRRRDEVMLPIYRTTLAHTSAPNPSPEALSWLQAMTANAGLVRTLAHALPTAVLAPGVLPAPVLRAVEQSAGRFAAAAQDTRMDDLAA